VCVGVGGGVGFEALKLSMSTELHTCPPVTSAVKLTFGSS